MSSSKYYTVDDLITSVKNRGMIPEGQITFQDNDLLRFANEEIKENLIALILGVREDFYMTPADIQLGTGNIYNIPYRAIGSKIRILKPLTNNVEGAPLVPIPPDLSWASTNTNYTVLKSVGYYVQDNQFVVVPNSQSLGTGTLRLYYYLRPNDLVAVNRCSKITAIDTTTNTVTVSSVPSNINTSVLLDIVQAKPNHKIYNYDLNAVVNSLTKTITFTNTLPIYLEVGDYVCTAGETPTPQIPVDIVPILEQSVVCKVLEALGDSEGLKNAYARLQKLEKNLYNIIDNRIEAPGKKIVNYGGFLRQGNRYRF